jgi:hypothetical protein
MDVPNFARTSSWRHRPGEKSRSDSAIAIHSNPGDQEELPRREERSAIFELELDSLLPHAKMIY